MRVVALGGAGGMGATASRHLATLDAVTTLVVADLDVRRAQALVDGLGRPGVTAAGVDVRDGAALRRLLADAALVLNCTGPYFRFGVPVLEAAIDTRTTYVDLCDDPAPTRAMLALDGRARDAGVAAVIGMGASPGLSNLLARRAAARLDTVTDCFTAWPLDVRVPGQTGAPRDEGVGPDGRPSAAAIHLMEQIAGRILVAEGGRLVERVPLEAVALDVPGVGRGTAYTVGHPEPLTLTSSLRVRGRAANVMLVRRTTVPYLRGLQRDLDAGRLDRERAAALAVRPAVTRLLAALPGAWRVAGPGTLPPFFALLHGTRDGRPWAAGCHVTALPAGMAGATAVPAALAVAQLLGAPAAPGVHPPEAAIDGARLLDALRAHCDPVPPSVDALAPLTEGPQP